MYAVRQFLSTTFASLAIRNYRLYFIGQSISLCGTWMQTVALGWLVLQLTGSGTQLGLVVALQFLPLLTLGPWGGVVVDRLDRRRILYITQTIFGFCALAISILVFTGAIEVWMLYIFSLCLGLVRVIDNPARQAFASEMVGGERIKNVVSLNSTQHNLARAVGPSIAGVLIATVGIAFCFLINALSFLALIFTLYLMHGNELHQSPPEERKPGQLTDGLRYVTSSPIIRNTLVLIAVLGIFAYEFQVSLPLLAQQTFHGDASTYAWLLGAFGVGSVVGGLFAAGRHTIAPHQLIIFAALFGLSIIAAALMPTLSLAIAGMVVVGFFSINVTSTANTMIQLESLSSMRGRVMALWGMAFVGSQPIGGPLIGFIGEHIGARAGLAIGGIATLAAAAWAAFAFFGRDRLQVVPAGVEVADEDPTDDAKL